MGNSNNDEVRFVQLTAVVVVAVTPEADALVAMLTNGGTTTDDLMAKGLRTRMLEENGVVSCDVTASPADAVVDERADAVAQAASALFV